MDYIRGVLAEPRIPRVESLRSAQTMPAMPSSIQPSAQQSSSAAPTAPGRSQWERFTLADGMELHVRRPLSRLEQRYLDKLMAAARKIFDESEGEEQ